MRNLIPDHLRRVVAEASAHGSLGGAVLVVDAEGSTALSARLSSHGTAGAEALADVLNAVFSPMVDEVIAAGGFVAEFAGDGIVAVFPGPTADATHRAVAAGQRILSALDAYAEVPTPDGPASLSARAVVGAGSTEWVIWRSSDSDAPQAAAYTYLGSALAEAQRGEKTTGGGVLAVGPLAAATLPDFVVVADLGDGFARVRSMLPVPNAGDLQPSNRGTSAPFFPDEIAQLSRRGEFRDVVTVFLELDHLPPAGPNGAMTAVLDRLQAHRGYLCDVIRPGPSHPGVRVLAFWGAPTSYEHDIGHALRFVADVMHSVGRTSVRAGVTQDTVFAGFVGTASHESYTGIGSGVNLAARMCGAAEWGELRVGRPVAERLDRRWTTSELGPVPYRGFSDPVESIAVTFVPAVRRSDPFDDLIVGRNEELATLEAALTPLWTDAPAGVIAISGEAGIGKSHLVNALRSRLAERSPAPTWLTAQADEVHTQPLSTLRDALEGYFGGAAEDERGERLGAYIEGLRNENPELSGELERSRRTLGDLLDLTDDVQAARNLDPKTRFENAVLAFEDVVLALARRGPVILSVADAQWLDDGTTQVLRRIRSDLSDRPVVILLETRADTPPLPADEIVPIAALRRDDVAAIANRILGRPAAPPMVDLLLDRTGGNPFFVRQVLDLMHRESLFVEGPDGVEPRLRGDEVPTDLRQVLTAQLDALPEDVRSTIQIASVLGREFDLSLLGEITGDDLARRHADRAAAEGIWAPTASSRFEFRQGLVRDTAYAMQLHAEVRRIHARAASALERRYGGDDRGAAELAHHSDRAGRVEDAVRYYGIAGRAAARQYADTEARALTERGLELAGGDHEDERYRLLRLRHDIFDLDGDRTSQGDTLDAMAALVDDDPIRRWEVAHLRGELLTALGDYPAAEAAARKALKITNGEALARQRGETLFALAKIARYRGDTTAAQALADQAASALEALAAFDRSAAVADFIGGLAWDRGEFDTAIDHHQRAVDAFRAGENVVGEIRALNNLGSAIFGRGDYSTARQIHERGVERSRQIGYRMGEGDHLDNVGGTAWAIGDYELAVERYGEALEIRRRMHDAWGVAISTSNLGAAYRAMGHLEAALRMYEEALEINQSIGRRRGEAYDLHGLGLTRLDMGALDAAVETLDAAAAIRAELEEPHLANESRIACATAMSRRGERTAARQIVEAVLDAEGSDPFEGAVETTATLMRCIEVLGEDAPARAAELRASTVNRVERRAQRISDPQHRASYLDAVTAHRAVRSPQT